MAGSPGGPKACRLGMVVSALLTIMLVSGCSHQKGPEFAPVQGVVRINNKPKAGLLIRFSPDPKQGNGFPAFATGTSDAQGKYTLRYEFRDKEGAGAPVGWHRVSVIDTSVGFTPQGQAPKPSAVPIQYANPSTTPIVKEVKASADPQEIDIDIRT